MLATEHGCPGKTFTEGFAKAFARTYTDHKKADGFADRQKKSPVVKMARVIQIS